ncbi:MAG: hypothetical protein ACRD0N_11580 [Acidimicrobiales bacterium]
MSRRALPAMGRAALMAGALLTAGCGGGGDSATGQTSTTMPGREPGGDTTSTTIAEGFGPATLVGQVADPEVDESSGLAASRRSPGLLWTHNDSGDEPRLYCLTGRGASCGTWTVAGADAFDWEDMAAGPGPAAGEHYLYLGDIGDNRSTRANVVVYRVREPVADAAAGGAAASTSAAEALTLRYADGPHDAEALMAHPATGDLYIVTKALSSGGVYKAPAGTSLLTRVAGIDLGPGEAVTGGDISPDGRRVTLSTYRRGYELSLPAGAGDLDTVWSQPPVPVDLGVRAQGESVAYRLDGNGLFTTSEKLPVPMYLAERRR